MYKLIVVGFVFFMIVMIFGVLWVVEVWGGYWSWDLKEIWVLIVWLNYVVWLYMWLMKGLCGVVVVWWVFIGLLVMMFVFFGVNMFLFGLYSYGKL